ncbi:hypothetical protein PsorP6_012313 [Peronosclerospora sorghi]|uniref:Uncharacterized protein n=1 Tax=Peronosclerospora sorghi TaxID=230839 RepID=A0ACC0WF82_9STRA|nr:hypothetical protein PsorP6_012313 [Peronosclerospora sorghi]
MQKPTFTHAVLTGDYRPAKFEKVVNMLEDYDISDRFSLCKSPIIKAMAVLEAEDSPASKIYEQFALLLTKLMHL